MFGAGLYILSEHFSSLPCVAKRKKGFDQITVKESFCNGLKTDTEVTLNLQLTKNYTSGRL